MKKANKKFKEEIKKHLKNLQKDDPEIDLILADGNPRSERDLNDDQYIFSEKPEDYKPKE